MLTLYAINGNLTDLQKTEIIFIVLHINKPKDFFFFPKGINL